MGKTCTHEFFKNAQIALVLRTRAILYVFEKLTRACFSQIALETILLPILILLVTLFFHFLPSISGIHPDNTLTAEDIDNWGGGAHIHIFVFTDCKNNQFQKKLIAQISKEINCAEHEYVNIPPPNY